MNLIVACIIHYGVYFSIFLRIISCIILLLFCIPLQIKEVRVKNGLRILRMQLLTFGILLLFTNIFSLLFLYLALPALQNLINSLLQGINALAFLMLALIGHSMYHRQYTEENKQFHEEVQAREDKKLRHNL